MSAVIDTTENSTDEAGEKMIFNETSVHLVQEYSLIQEKAQLEAMNRELSQMILKMNMISSQGLLLNVDIVSQFDPAVAQELAALVEDCNTCTARINERMEQAYTCLNADQPHTEEGNNQPIGDMS